MQVKGSVRKGEELKQYVELLRGKSATYKALKEEMDDMSVEYGVLMRTQQLLEQQIACHEIDGDSVAYSSFNDSNLSVEYEVIQCTRRLMQQQANGNNIITIESRSNEHIKSDELAPYSNNTSNGQQDLKLQSKKIWQEIGELDLKLHNQRVKVAPLLKKLKDVQATLHDIEVQHAEQQCYFLNMSIAYER